MRFVNSIFAGIALTLLVAVLIYAIIFIQYLIAGAQFHYIYFVYYSLKKGLFVGLVTTVLFFLGGPRKINASTK